MNFQITLDPSSQTVSNINLTQDIETVLDKNCKIVSRVSLILVVEIESGKLIDAMFLLDSLSWCDNIKILTGRQ